MDVPEGLTLESGSPQKVSHPHALPSWVSIIHKPRVANLKLITHAIYTSNNKYLTVKFQAVWLCLSEKQNNPHVWRDEITMDQTDSQPDPVVGSRP